MQQKKAQGFVASHCIIKGCALTYKHKLYRYLSSSITTSMTLYTKSSVQKSDFMNMYMRKHRMIMILNENKKYHTVILRYFGCMSISYFAERNVARASSLCSASAFLKVGKLSG